MSYSDRCTDRRLKELEKKIEEIYGLAFRQIGQTIDEFYNGTVYVDSDGNQVRGRSLADKAADFRELVEKGVKTEEEYKQWLLNQIGRGKRFEAMRDKIAQRMTEANQTAIAYINDATPGIYSLNRNYEAYAIESVSKKADFTLFDESTVRRLIRDAPETMPYYPKQKALQRGIDLEYGKQQITKQVTSGILRGASIPDIAKQLRSEITTMNYKSSIRAARTAVTSAQNGGRMDSYRAAEKMGIGIQREWLATLDKRTRHAHQELDGQRRRLGEKFTVNGDEIEFPGDPNAKGYLVYNCRCTLVPVVDGINMDKALRRDQYGLIPNMTYRQWENTKRGEGILQK